MRDNVGNIGKNAGRIWKMLEQYGPLQKDVLIKRTRLKDENFYYGLGWLARENKICKNGKTFELKPTNLTGRIGKNAGKIWGVLNNQNELDISTISKLSKVKIQDAYSAVGWLAREDKLVFDNGKFKLK